MPIKRCTTDSGGSGWKYGDSGKCYRSRKDAIKQMKAIKWRQSQGNISFKNEGLTFEELLSLGLDTQIIESNNDTLEAGSSTD